MNINGEKNGKGKEYYTSEFLFPGLIKFEGEYLNNKKWTGKGYDLNENLLYELKNGKGYIKENDKENEC